jgi:voltage-gated potassium channel Kch
VLALTCPDPMAEMAATTYAREVNPKIDVVALLTEESLANRLRQLGVSEIVEPPLETSLEFVRHILTYYGVDAVEIEGIACPFLKRLEGEIIS